MCLFLQEGRAGRYREHIQNWRPRLTPGFLVVRLMHGSAWLSQRGGGRREKSFVQLSFEASCCASGSEGAEEVDWLALKLVDGDGGGLFSGPTAGGFGMPATSLVGPTVDGGAVSGWEWGSAGLERDWKKPLSDC